jgi:hypothetical protein
MYQSSSARFLKICADKKRLAAQYLLQAFPKLEGPIILLSKNLVVEEVALYYRIVI